MTTIIPESTDREYQIEVHWTCAACGTKNVDWFDATCHPCCETCDACYEDWVGILDLAQYECCNERFRDIDEEGVALA